MGCQTKKIIENISEGLTNFGHAMGNARSKILDFQDFSQPIQALNASMQKVYDGFINPFSQVFEQITIATENLFSSIDVSIFTQLSQWGEQRQTLLDYGWFISQDIPEQIIEDIYYNKDSLSVIDVNKIIVDYFRNNRCKELKRITKVWNSLPIFARRADVFHQAIMNHVRKYYNASITILIAHTEGVISDFVREVIEKPKYYINKAIAEVKEEMNNCEGMAFYEYRAYIDVISRIETAFLEKFEPANPHNASGNSRNKIAHGHDYEKRHEVDSLKQFLYLNELYHLFSFLLTNRIAGNSD